MQKIHLNFKTTLFSTAIMFVALLSSCQSNKIKIEGRFITGVSNIAYLEDISSEGGVIIDSVALNPDGEFKFEIKTQDKHHKLYNVVFDWSTIPIFAAAGDKVTLNSVGNVAGNYTVEGSEESELVRIFYQSYIRGIARLDAIAVEYGQESISEERRIELARNYSTEYNHIKREQLEFIIQNKGALAAVYALHQRLPNDSYLFTGRNDVIYYRTVAEALEERYAESPYRKSLLAQIENFDNINRITSNIEERTYPDLELPDMFGNRQKLSSLEGNVILLDFWSAQLGSSNRNNAELKEIYNEYKDSGFEVYQVAIDDSKSKWINTIQEQALPWISVSDLKGNRSTSLTLYNVTALPSNFVISRNGDIVARDVYGEDLLTLLRSEIAK